MLTEINIKNHSVFGPEYTLDLNGMHTTVLYDTDSIKFRELIYLLLYCREFICSKETKGSNLRSKHYNRLIGLVRSRTSSLNNFQLRLKFKKQNKSSEYSISINGGELSGEEVKIQDDKKETHIKRTSRTIQIFPETMHPLNNTKILASTSMLHSKELEIELQSEFIISCFNSLYLYSKTDPEFRQDFDAGYLKLLEFKQILSKKDVEDSTVFMCGAYTKENRNIIEGIIKKRAATRKKEIVNQLILNTNMLYGERSQTGLSEDCLLTMKSVYRMPGLDKIKNGC